MAIDGSGLRTLVAGVLARAETTPQGQAELRRFNHVIRFDVTDGLPFYVRIIEGTITVQGGDPGALPFEEMETIRGNAGTLRAVFQGRARIVDLGWDGQLNLPLYGPKMHITAWLCRLIKLAHGQPIKPHM